MSQSDCRDIVSRARECEFLRGEKIFLQGDPVRNVTLLTSGSAKITQLGQNGSEVILRIVGPGDIVTGFCLQCSHGSLAQVRHDSKALVWDTSVFEALAVRFSELQRNVLNILSDRLRELEERYREVSTEDVGNPAESSTHAIVHASRATNKRHNRDQPLPRGAGTIDRHNVIYREQAALHWRERGVLRARRETVSVQNVEALRELAKSG